jgi:predicted phosphate transport protein (TIGR00153 family)
MKAPSLTLFGKTKAMEGMIDDFLDQLSNGGMKFEQGVAAYLDSGPDGTYTNMVSQIRNIEVEGNRLRRTIEIQLYTEMLIPDLRADVLSLMEDLNYLLGLTEDTFLALTVERPMMDEIHKADFRLITSHAVKTMEAAVLASRAFFRNIAAVRDHLNKVGFHEEEVDQIATRLKRAIFDSDIGLDRKMHLRYFVDKIDSLADEAESVGDWLAIYSIKRAM